jgi:ribosomal protein S18 acetylase RimI-like enzyme
MTHNKTQIRNMQEHDLAAVLQIQRECFDEATQESLRSFQVKLAASPSTCFVAIQGQSVLGYLVALPADSQHPPVLHGETYEIPSASDCLYLHDLSVSRLARGAGVAKILIEAFLLALQQLRLPRACLTAVNNSGSYWARYGFQTVLLSDNASDSIATYGAGAQYMMLTVTDIGLASSPG